MKLVILFSIIFFTLKSFASYDYKASIKTKDYDREMKIVRTLDLDVPGVDYDSGVIDVLISENDRLRLKEFGLVPEINWSKGVSVDVSLDAEYKTSFEVERFLQTAEGLFPELTQLVEIGKSVEGRSIWALKISDNAAERELDEPTVLFNSMHHAREIMTPEVTMDLVEYLLSNYESDPRVKDWVDKNEIWVVPMLNVDGNHIVWNEDSFWRKNARDGHGVDLNRNYPYNWNSCGGSSGNKSSDTYRGPEPASEPETRALMSLVEEIKPVFDISYHSYSNLVLYPYGCRNDRGASPEAMIEIGNELGELLNYRAGTPPELLYQADGGDIDWMLGEHQVIPYVIELNSRLEGFQPDYASTRDKTVELNRKGWMLLLDRLHASGIRGRVDRPLTAAEYKVRVYKEGELIQIYRVNPDGTFHIVLPKGEYSVEYDFASSLSTQKYQVGESLIEVGVF